MSTVLSSQRGFIMMVLQMCVTDVYFFYLWEVGRRNIRQLRPTKLDDLHPLKDDQVAVILEGPCRTEVRKWPA